MIHGQVGQDFSVELNALFMDVVHEFGVGGTIHAGAGIDACDPEAAESALFVAAVAIGILKGFFYGIFGYGIDVFTCTEVAFSQFEDFLATLARSDGVH